MARRDAVMKEVPPTITLGGLALTAKTSTTKGKVEDTVQLVQEKGWRRRHRKTRWTRLAIPIGLSRQQKKDEERSKAEERQGGERIEEEEKRTRGRSMARRKKDEGKHRRMARRKKDEEKRKDSRQIRRALVERQQGSPGKRTQGV